MTEKASANDIMRAIAEKHGIQVSDLTGKVRNKPLWAARREAVVAMREAGISLGRIYHALKRGKATIRNYLSPDTERARRKYLAKNGRSVRLNPELAQIIAEYAASEGIAIDVAANALLRDALSGARA